MYEMFRSSISMRLVDRLSPDDLQFVLNQMDAVALDYSITRQCTDLITVSDEPEPVKLYLAALAVEQKSMGTIRDYRSKLVRFFQHVRKSFNTVTTNDIRTYMFHYQQESHLEKSSLDHVRSVINGFYNWLVDQDIMQKNPCRLIEPIKYNRKKLPPLEQIDLEYLRSACETPREKALVDFLVSSGCRVSECASVKMADINWQHRTVIIHHGKGDKERTVCFNAEAEVSMKAYITSKGRSTEYLFSSSRAPYGGLSREAIEKQIAKLRNRISDKVTVRTTPHTLRRTMATTASNNGMPVEDIQFLLGHASLDTTMQYISKNSKRVHENYNRYMAG